MCDSDLNACRVSTYSCEFMSCMMSGLYEKLVVVVHRSDLGILLALAFST